MFLIMSGSYVDQELRAEFGKIPPSFLPVGNRRLLQHQVKLIPNSKSIYLSLPEDYVLANADNEWLTNNQVAKLRMPPPLRGGTAIAKPTAAELLDLYHMTEEKGEYVRLDWGAEPPPTGLRDSRAAAAKIVVGLGSKLLYIFLNK